MPSARGDSDRLMRLYDAAVEDRLWPEVLHDLASGVGAIGCCIAVDNASETLIAPPVSTELVEPIRDFIDSGWYLRDLRGRRGWPLFRSGRKVLIEHDVSTEEERRHGDYHNEWLKPWDLPWWAAVGFSFEDHRFGLAILRSSRQGAFTRKEAARLERWRPHLVRALRMAMMVSAKRADSILEFLEWQKKPAFLLGTNGLVSEMNTQAENMLGGELTLRHGVLRAVSPDNDAKLQRLVSAALAPPFPSFAHEEVPVALRRGALRPLVVEALPTIGLLSEMFVRTRALLLVTDLEKRPAVNEGRLKQLLELTNAEAAVASRIAAGTDVAQVALELGITVGTVRNHLKSIFAKVGARRQSDLAASIHMLPSAR